jgi:hypothetical protein
MVPFIGIDIVVRRRRLTPASMRPLMEDPMTPSWVLPTLAGPYMYFTVAQSVTRIDVTFVRSGRRRGNDLKQLLRQHRCLPPSKYQASNRT